MKILLVGGNHNQLDLLKEHFNTDRLYIDQVTKPVAAAANYDCIIYWEKHCSSELRASVEKCFTEKNEERVQVFSCNNNTDLLNAMTDITWDLDGATIVSTVARPDTKVLVFAPSAVVKTGYRLEEVFRLHDGDDAPDVDCGPNTIPSNEDTILVFDPEGSTDNDLPLSHTPADKDMAPPYCQPFMARIVGTIEILDQDEQQLSRRIVEVDLSGHVHTLLPTEALMQAIAQAAVNDAYEVIRTAGQP